MANVPPATVTITSTIGPGLTSTAQVFSNVTELTFDYVKNTVKIAHKGGLLIAYYDYSAIATGTITITTGLTAVVLST